MLKSGTFPLLPADLQINSIEWLSDSTKFFSLLSAILLITSLTSHPIHFHANYLSEHINSIVNLLISLPAFVLPPSGICSPSLLSTTMSLPPHISPSLLTWVPLLSPSCSHIPNYLSRGSQYQNSLAQRRVVNKSLIFSTSDIDSMGALLKGCANLAEDASHTAPTYRRDSRP